MKIKLDKQGNEVDVDESCILTNDVIFDHEYNPHNERFWIIDLGYGTRCLVWASHEQDALDEACDEGLLDCILVDEEDLEPDIEYNYLGNASEAADLTDVHMQSIDLSIQELPFLLKLAEARGAGVDEDLRNCSIRQVVYRAVKLTLTSDNTYIIVVILK